MFSNCIVQGSTDPALEQHLADLRQQNADLDIASVALTSQGEMASALVITIRLAEALSAGTGGQDLIQHARSVLDAVNQQLYPMLSGGGSVGDADGNSQEQQQQQQQQQDKKPEKRNKVSAAAWEMENSDESDSEPLTYDDHDRLLKTAIAPSSSSSNRQPPHSPGSTNRPSTSSSKRFRFGL